MLSVIMKSVFSMPVAFVVSFILPNNFKVIYTSDFAKLVKAGF